MFSCSSQVPGAADVLRSPAAPPEGAERSEAEAGQAAGPHQPAGPGPPAQVRFCRSPLIPGQTRGLRSLLVVQVSGGAGAAAAGLHGDAGGEDRRSSPRSGPGGGAGSAGGSHDVMAFPVRSSLTVSLSLSLCFRTPLSHSCWPAWWRWRVCPIGFSRGAEWTLLSGMTSDL